MHINTYILRISTTNTVVCTVHSIMHIPYGRHALSVFSQQRVVILNGATFNTDDGQCPMQLLMYWYQNDVILQ